MNEQRIGVVVLNYFSSKKVDRLLQTINTQDDGLSIYIVDNSCCKSEVRKLRSLSNDVSVIVSSENGGFSAGTNLGIKRAISDGCDGVLILNPDTVLFDDFFVALSHASKEFPGRAISPLGLHLNDDTIWSAGGDFFWIKGRADVRKPDVSLNDLQVTTTDFGTCACIYVPRSILEKVGLLDEDYFLGGEEWQLSLAINRVSSILFVPSIRYRHEISGTHQKYGRRFFYMGMRTKTLFVSKNYRLWWFWMLIFFCSLPRIYLNNKKTHSLNVRFFFITIVRCVWYSLSARKINEAEFIKSQSL